MPITADQFKSIVTPLEQELTKELINAHKTDPSLGLDGLIDRLTQKKDSISQSFVPAQQVALDDRIQGRVINDFYSSVLTDLHILFGSGMDADKTLSSFKEILRQKIDQMETTIRTQEGDLRELKFLRDNTEYVEAFDMSLASNGASDNRAVYNSSEKTLSLSVNQAQRTPVPELNVTILGSPDRNVLPDYEPAKAFDRTTLSSWYEIVGYKAKPRFILDPTQDNPITFVLTSLEYDTSIPMDAGNTEIAINPDLVEINQNISLGELFTHNHETVRVIGKNASSVVVSQLKYKHFPFEPVYSGQNLIQSNGAVALIDMEFTYPQQVNFMRLAPFSSKPLVVHGIYIPTEDSFSAWELVPGTQFDSLDKLRSFTFDRTISNKFRLIIEQTHGEFFDKNVSVSSTATNVAWNVIYENEFQRKVFSMENQLANFDEQDIRQADLTNTRGFLVRRKELENITARQNSKKDGSVRSASEVQLNTLSEFLSGSEDVDKNAFVNIKRFTYDIGLSDIQLMLNQYKPSSDFVGPLITPEQNNSAYSLFTKHELPDDTSIEHYLQIQTGENLPIPNRSYFNSSGEIVSRNEFLDVEPSTRIAKLKFQPFKDTITIDIKRVGLPDSTIQVLVVNNEVEIPQASYDQKAVYETTYALEDNDLHLQSNLISEPTKEIFSGTNEGEFLVLNKAPVIELGIVNDDFRFVRKDPFVPSWSYITNANFDDTLDWVDRLVQGKSFPVDGTVIDNVYYGRGGENEIKRTPALETHLMSIFSRYSGDSVTQLERFFAKYEGEVLQANLEYSPITVKVNDTVALCVSEFNGNPPSGFIASHPSHLQYRIFGNRLMFVESLDNNFDIEVEYRIKETTITYAAKLRSNRKSNFWTSPVLSEAMVGSIL